MLSVSAIVALLTLVLYMLTRTEGGVLWLI
jgi:hypothetical protein